MARVYPRILLVIASIAFVVSVTKAQPSGSRLIKTGEQFGYEVKPTRDGGFIIGGHNTEQGELKYWVVKCNKNGEVQWDSSYSNNSSFNYLWSVETTKNGGYLIAGYALAPDSNTEALLFSLDSVGRVIKRVEVNYHLDDHAHWFSDAPGGYYWSGHTDSKGDRNGDMILQKLDTAYNLVWEKIYDGGQPEHDHAGTLTLGGGAVLAGHSGFDEICWINKVDTGGEVIWSNHYGSDLGSASPYTVFRTKENNYAVVGGSWGASDGMWLLVVDSNGNEIVNKSYGLYSSGYSGIQTPDGGYLIIGDSGISKTNKSMMYAVRTDDTGTVKWQRTYPALSQTEGKCVLQLGDNYLLVGGVIDDQGDEDLWMLLIDSNGNVVKETQGVHAQFTLADRMNVMPNPASYRGSISLSVDMPDAGPGTISIFDESGRLAMEVTRALGSGRHLLRIPLSTTETPLQPGAYLLRFKTSGFESSQKLIIR